MIASELACQPSAAYACMLCAYTIYEQYYFTCWPFVPVFSYDTLGQNREYKFCLVS